MALNLTTPTLRALDELSIEPNLIVRIDGFETLFSAVVVTDYLLYGCPGVFYGDDDLFYGGFKGVENNEAILDSRTTSFSIRQQMNYDVAKASSISSMNVGLVDKNEIATQLISPGFDIEDILGRKVDIFVTFGEVSFFDDSILIFRGFVTKVDSQAGLVKLKVNHPDNKKQVELFKSVETKIDGALNASATTIPVINATTFINEQGSLTSYIRIENELIQYTGTTATSFTGCTRGALSTTAVGHDDESQVRALYCLEGNPLDLALQLMMSGFGTDPVHTDIEASSFVRVGAGSTQIANSIYFDQINIPQDFGLRAGDTVTTTLATNGANNFVGRTVTSVVKFETGFYIVVDGASLVLEDTTVALMDTFTQYNTLPDGIRMNPEEVDIDEHLKIRDFFHSATEMRIYLKEDAIEAKEFIVEQLYKPIACYELPRKAQSSIGFTVGPIPGEGIVTLDQTNSRNPQNVQITRTTNRSFYNEVVYRYDDTPLLPDIKFQTGAIIISQTSKNRIPGTSKTFSIPSLGLRSDLSALTVIGSNSQRIINRYQFAAEIVSVKALMRDTIGLEIGDVLVGDFKALKVSDITQGNRDFKARLFEVQNKTTNLKTGDTDLMLLDTGLNLDTRYGLMSQCSPIVGVISQSQFVIGPDALYPSKFGADEYRKWNGLVGPAQTMSVLIRNDDYTIQEDLVVSDISGNTFTLQDPAAITLTTDLMVEFTGYLDTDTSDKQKLVYAYMTDDANFPDGGFPYLQI